jgi:hypothetical protein
VTQQQLPVRLHAASGSSEARDARAAGVEAATEAMAGLDGRVPAMIIVYATVRYDLPALLAGIRSVTGDVPLVGETSTGHFRGADFTEPASGVAVLAMTAGPYTFGFAAVERLSGGGEAAGVELARSARSAVEPTPYATLLIFVDGLAAEQQALVGGLHRVAGAAVPIVGGAAADDRRLSETFVFWGDRVLADAAVGVWIGSEHPVPVTVGHGWQPIGLPLLVTKTDGQVVHEIAGRPAFDVFQENIRLGNTDDLDQVRPGGFYSTHAFGLIEPDGTHLIRGVFMGDGKIHTFAPLPVYSAVQIMGCNEEDLLATSHDVAERAVAGRDASVLLVFSCIARLDILAERGPEEAARLQAAAGTVPTFGLYTYGEFARTTSVAGYHNATVTAVAL